MKRLDFKLKLFKITKVFFGILLVCLFSGSAIAWGGIEELTSPDNNIKVRIELADRIYYSVSANNFLLLEKSYLELRLKDQILGENPKLTTKKRSTIQEQINREIPLKNAVVDNHCNVLLLKFKGDYSVEFRAYNDGVAYRFITNKDDKDIEVLDEAVHLQFPSTFDAVLSPTRSFKTSYEISYVESNTADAEGLEKSTLPILIDSKQRFKILFSEADLFDYPCLFMKGVEGNAMNSTFPKCPIEFGEDGDRSLKIVKEADYIAKTTGSRSFPWRVFMISSEDKQIFENEMVFKLSRPNELGNVDWIKPGQVSWEWWHDARLYRVDFKSGYNLDSYKYYIDFASDFGIPYIIMDEGWAKSTRDPYTPNPTIDLFKLIEYGKTKNVKIVLWLTWLTVENNMDLFKTFSEWGIAGVKIDFMDRSDQWMVNYYERVAREAAKYHLFVDYHGSFKPAGMERALPNILSYEGIVGMEQNIGGGRATTKNNAYLPFIRNAVGPADFTPGAMNSVHPEDYKSTRTNPVSIGTRAYQLALYVTLESGIQMLADNPFYYYRERECTEFITSVPVVWDETRVLQAKAGEYFVVARRSKNKWFIGAITDTKERSFKLNLDFLNDGATYKMTAFQDGVNANVQAMDYKKVTKNVSSGETIEIDLARDGGWAAVIEQVK
ncbi:glycoside hydrolase family 97 protein [Maribellus sediminis]|uniref:glycoside hydrolase family 97 protein n=1 Tax=Maribellus sediminis TaxID=2696285 RepID=UPI00142FCAAF|nr:glycoside hydrolase family 97 protein [Maribellus sediminis]